MKALPDAVERLVTSAPAPDSAAERLVFRALLLEAYLMLASSVAAQGFVPPGACERAMTRFVRQVRMYPPSQVFVSSSDRLLGDVRSLAAKPLHQRAICWLEHMWDQRVSIPKMARDLHVPVRTLTRQFRKHTGITIHEYVSRMRVERADGLFTSTDWKVEAVAAAVGFHSKTSLYRAFERMARPRAARRKPR